MELFLGLRQAEGSSDRLAHFPSLATPYPDTTTPLLGGLDPAEEGEGEASPATSPQHAVAAAVGVSPMSPPSSTTGRQLQPRRSLGVEAPALCPPDQQQQQQDDDEEEGPGAAALLAGLPLHSHDGVVGVHADLLDLEPLEPFAESLSQQNREGSSRGDATPSTDPLGAGDLGAQLRDLLL